MSRHRKIVLLVIVNASLFATTYLNEMVITIFPAYATNQVPIDASSAFSGNASSGQANATSASHRIDNSKVASLIGIKYATQIVAFPISGMVTDKISPGLIMLSGLVLESVSCFIYCASESFVVVCVARFIDGVGSAFYSTAGLTLIYIVTPSNQFRNKLITINSICTFVGISLAPLAAGASYQYTLARSGSADTARWVTFLTIGPALVLVTIAVVPIAFYPSAQRDSGGQSNSNSNSIYYDKGSISFLQTAAAAADPATVSRSPSSHSFTHMGIIAKDPYILITVAYILMFSIPLNSFQSTLPTYMNVRFGSDGTNQGIVWLGCLSSIPGFVVGSIVYHKFFNRCWLVCMLNLQVMGVFSALMAFVEPWWTTSIILGIMNFSGSIIEVILVPFIAVLIDKRYTSNYGGCSSLTMLSYTLSGVLGTFPVGFLVEKTHFSVLCYLLALLCIPLSPTIAFCRKYFHEDIIAYSVTDNDDNDVKS